MKSNKIITCASYHGTGSSAISDLLKEFSNCYSTGEYEFRFIQDPYGISDLEFHLIENTHRLNSGYFLKKFIQQVDFLSGNKIIKRYERYFNGKFKEYSMQYVKNLIEVEWQGESYFELTESKLFYIQRFINKIARLISRNNELEVNILRNNKLYLCKQDKNFFYEQTKEYLYKLFNELNKEKKEFLMLDQLVPPTNIERYFNYFYNLKVIVVDRDPRDLYILQKLYWKDNVFPTDTPSSFVKWFKGTRKNKIINDNILYLNFEDLIYNYELTLKKIASFLETDLSNHTKKFSFFDPKISIHNTRLWINQKNLSSDIKIIEQELQEYCYESNE